jgi:large subunit ribosomal protein L33
VWAGGWLARERLCLSGQGVLLACIEENEMREIIDMACTLCKQRNYSTMKNKKNDPDRLERNKFCKFCRKHAPHKEVK